MLSEEPDPRNRLKATEMIANSHKIAIIAEAVKFPLSTVGF